jgi:hypothetical protein
MPAVEQAHDLGHRRAASSVLTVMRTISLPAAASDLLALPCRAVHAADVRRVRVGHRLHDDGVRAAHARSLTLGVPAAQTRRQPKGHTR